MNSQAGLREAVEHLYYWQRCGGDNFHSILYMMFQKGSPMNRERLGMGFPFEYEAWKLWQHAPNETLFFEGFGFTETRPTSKEEPESKDK